MIHSAEAPSNLVEAEAISRELGNTAHLSMNMSARGGVLYEMGRYKEAIQAYTKTIELSDGADVAAFRHACCNQIA